MKNLKQYKNFKKKKKKKEIKEEEEYYTGDSKPYMAQNYPSRIKQYDPNVKKEDEEDTSE